VSLEDYGWGTFFEVSLEALRRAGVEGLQPGRVVLASGGSFRLASSSGELVARLSGRFRHHSGSLPTVGDWVAFDADADADAARIHALLERRTKLSRKAAGRKTEEQVVAANVDQVAAVMGLDSDFNPRRLERFLATIWESGALPLVLLTKLDLCPEPEARVREAEAIALGVRVHALSSLEGSGVEDTRALFRPRETVVLVGSSGVGKSTLINRLMNREIQRTRPVRAGDERGRHTTSHRELFVLPGGALLIDNPGVREIQLFGGEGSLERTFADVADLAERCRFRDCTHRGEPDCAVLTAVESGALASDRLESFRSLEKELRYLALREDEAAKSVEKKKWRAIHREMRRSGRHRRT
jgi:ribosome biogenesis GTPase / thiamine phosphate phosphatase